MEAQDLIISISWMVSCLGLTTGGDRMGITRFEF